MARALRLASPGNWHHVMNRGALRAPIFVDDRDRELFLSTLHDAVDRWGVETHAYALMDNHFHLLVRDGTGLLSRAMRHICGVHTLRFNRRHQRDGPLLRGRFRSRLVQTDEYLAELVRYIHANPLDIAGVQRAGDYRWSSHRSYLAAPGTRPQWLRTDEVFQRIGGDSPAGRRYLDQFVHERQPPAIRKVLDEQHWAPALGDEAFVKAARNAARERGHAEPATPHRKFASRTPAELVQLVADCMGVARDTIRSSKRGHRNTARQLSILFCVDHSPATAREIGLEFGIRRTTVPALACRVRRAAVEDAELRAWIQRIAAALNGAAAVPPGEV